MLDCDGTDECWPESWIGDGFPDCEDQQYGADLTCYDNDGGDCGGLFSLEGNTRALQGHYVKHFVNPGANYEVSRERATLTGYNVYRSLSGNVNDFTLIADVPADETTYTLSLIHI